MVAWEIHSIISILRYRVPVARRPRMSDWGELASSLDALLLDHAPGLQEPLTYLFEMDAPVPLGADHNLPYVFDSFVYQGRFVDEASGGHSILLDTPEPREDELPLANSLVTFPAPRGH
jgi:hypothetical protein